MRRKRTYASVKTIGSDDHEGGMADPRALLTAEERERLDEELELGARTVRRLDRRDATIVLRRARRQRGF